MGFTAVQNSKPIGSIETAPIATTTLKGYLYCDGASYLRTDYPLLFDAIGTAHGAADGTHFNVPDYRGVFLRGKSGLSSSDPDKNSRPAMNAGGNTNNNVGSMQNSEFASHAHGWSRAGNGLGGTTGFNGLNDLMAGGNSPPVGINLNPTQLSGGNETRPVNAYVEFFIRY